MKFHEHVYFQENHKMILVLQAFFADLTTERLELTLKKT